MALWVYQKTDLWNSDIHEKIIDVPLWDLGMGPVVHDQVSLRKASLSKIYNAHLQMKDSKNFWI